MPPLTGWLTQTKILPMAGSICIWFPGTLEMAVILIVGLVLFGGRLPEVGKSIGRSLIEFRKGLRDLKRDAGLGEVTELRDELRDLTRLPPIEDAEYEEDPVYPLLAEEQDADGEVDELCPQENGALTKEDPAPASSSDAEGKSSEAPEEEEENDAPADASDDQDRDAN